jgi:chromosomal replication initiation ATPase DnaA
MSLQEELHRAHKERLIRLSTPRPKVEPKPEPRPIPVVEFDTMQSWIKRQKAIPLPKSGEPWFSITAEFEVAGPTIGKVMFAVAQHFNIPTHDLKGPYRTASIAYARQVAFYLSRKLTVRSFPEIGKKFGGRDHTTVLHGYRKIERLMKTDWTVAYDVAHAEALI